MVSHILIGTQVKRQRPSPMTNMPAATLRCCRRLSVIRHTSSRRAPPRRQYCLVFPPSPRPTVMRYAGYISSCHEIYRDDASGERWIRSASPVITRRDASGYEREQSDTPKLAECRRAAVWRERDRGDEDRLNASDVCYAVVAQSEARNSEGA